MKNWDSKWYPENTENNTYISDEMIHHSMQNCRIHLVQLLGKRRYKEVARKMKQLSR